MSSNAVVPQGPFRATRLWNDLVALFQTRMVCKKHFYRFKMVNNCFTGSEAVEWLHCMLQTHKMYGKHVTVDQTTRLLKKFLKFHVIEDLSGRHGTEDFTCNSKLYRFPANAKSAIIGFDYRQPFASKDLNNLDNENSGDPIVKYSAVDDDVTVSNLRKSPPKEAIKEEEIAVLPTQKQTLEMCYFERLEVVLHLSKDDPHDFLLSLKEEKILGQIELNVNKKGVEIADCLPVWLLKIMKCVANWPYNDDNDYPPYEGFERDMFKAIVEFFNKAQSTPLLTPSLYETWVKIYARCKSLDERCHDRKNHTEKEADGDGAAPTDSTLVENIQKKLMQAKMRHENLANRKMKKKCHQQQYIPTSTDPSAVGRNGHTHESAFQHSIHQSMHDLSRLGENNDGRFGQSTAGFFGSKALVKSARAKCASHYHLSRKLPHMEVYNDVDDVIVDDADKIYSHDDTEALTTFAPLNKDGQATVMSSVDNLLLDMSCCGDLTFANIGSTSTPTRSSQPPQQVEPASKFSSQQTSAHVKDDEILLLSSSSEEDTGPIENWTADSINTLSNRHKRARSEMDLKDKTIVHRLEVPPPILRRSREGSRHRIQSRYIPQQPQISPDLTTMYQPKLRNQARRSTSSAGRSSANNQQQQYGSNRRRGIKSSRPLSVIIQSPMKCDEFSSTATLKAVNHGRSREKYMSMGALNKTSSTTCQSPLSVALKQAKRQLTAKKVKQEDLHACEAFQLCLLALPPANRRTLLLFFRFADKVLNNPHLLHLDDHLTPRGLLIEKFTNSILRKEGDKKEEVARQIFGFLLDHSREIFVLPECVEEKIIASKLQSLKIEREKKMEESKKFFGGGGGYCEQVSKEEYERQKREDSELHLVNLLRSLCEDESIPAKERKRSLKQFQKQYPDIYDKHAKKIIFNEITTKKTPFALAIQKIRQMRL